MALTGPLAGPRKCSVPTPGQLSASSGRAVLAGGTGPQGPRQRKGPLSSPERGEGHITDWLLCPLTH